MILNSFQIENFSLTLDYYNIIKSVSENLLTYIKKYKSISLEYNKKLNELNTDYKNKSEILNKEIKTKNIDLEKSFHFINSIQKIIEIYNENLLLLTEEIDKEIRKYGNLNPDQVIPTCITGFKDLKDKVLKKVKESNNIKNIFFNEMANTEDIIYKYYSSYFKNNIENRENEKLDEPQKKEKNQKNIASEEIMNNHINNIKQLEEKYKKVIEDGKREENNFIKNAKFFSETVKKMVNEMFEKLKHLVLNFLISIKNNFKLPEAEIDSILPELIKLDSSLKIEKVIENYYHDDNKYKSIFEPEKYIFKDFKDDKKNINNKKKDEEKRIMEIEDGYDKLIFIKDENLLSMIKKMKNSFELINLEKLDIKIEEEKIKVKNLTVKLLSNLVKEKDYDKINAEIINISNEELKTLECLLEKHHNIVIFLQQLNKFRSTGRYIMNKKIYDLFGTLLNIILNKTKIDNDYFSTKNIIILSQTYYYKNENKKEYLQYLIYNHELLKDPKFWEDLFIFEMSKEIQKVSKIDLKNNLESNIEFNKEYNKNKYGNLAFGQIMTLSNNMLEFGLSPQLIFQVMEPKIRYYQLNKDLIKTIKSVIGITNEETNNNNEKGIINKENTEKDNIKEEEKEKDEIINKKNEDKEKNKNDNIENEDIKENKINNNENIIKENENKDKI